MPKIERVAVTWTREEVRAISENALVKSTGLKFGQWVHALVRLTLGNAGVFIPKPLPLIVPPPPQLPGQLELPPPVGSGSLIQECTHGQEDLSQPCTAHDDAEELKAIGLGEGSKDLDGIEALPPAPTEDEVRDEASVEAMQEEAVVEDPPARELDPEEYDAHDAEIDRLLEEANRSADADPF